MESVHRGRRMFLPIAGLALLAVGSRFYLYRYRLGRTPRQVIAWTIPWL